MKGLYQTFFLLRKNYFIFPAIAAFIIMVAGCLLLIFAESEDAQGITVMLILLAPMICAMLPGEAICLDFDRSIKTRYANYLLSGMSYTRFCNIELIKNLMVAAFSLAIVCVCDLAFWLANNTVMSLDMFMLHIISILIVNAGNWLLMPIVVKFRSADKAGLIIGLALGVIGAPLIILAFESEEILSKLISALESPLSVLVTLGVALAMYVVGYPLLLRTVKRGDIC